MAYCGKCGTQIEEGVKFCTSCGTTMGVAQPIYHRRCRPHHRTWS
ncbi:MAG: zinc-ribbon domain-containing protein [Bacteroidales bacterium]|nr:zinc-ribbon domain-containing protein [Bacteroidales bacterium]